MKYRIFIFFFRILICLILSLFIFYIYTIFIVSNVEATLKNIPEQVFPQKDNFFKKYNFIQVLPNLLKKDIDDDVITITASTHLPEIFTFSPVKFLQSLCVVDTADYLKNIPGFTSIRNGGINTDPVFRGMFGSRIRILIDNGEISGACCSRMDPASAYVYPGTFDVLNIIKGPQTVLLGPVSSGVTLQFERYHPRFDMSKIQLSSNFSVGSNNKIDKNIDSVIGNKHGYIRLIGNISHSDDYHDGSGYRVHSAWYKWNADAILSLNFGTDTFFEISLGQGNGNAKYATKATDGLCFARESYGIKIETTDIVNINDTLDKIALYTWYNYMNHVMGDNIYDKAVLSNKKCSCIDNNIDNVDRYIWGIRGIVTNQWEYFKCHSGVDVQMNQHGRIQNKIDRQIDFVSVDSGIFSELVLDTALDKKLIGGIRIDRYHITKANDLQYNRIYSSGFMRYENNIHPLFLYYVGVGTSQKPPDYWEWLHMQSGQHDSIKNNILIQKVNSERTIQADMGVCFQESQINGWISSYIGYVKNFILNYYGVEENNINNVNATICGVEAELNYQFNNNWNIKNNMMWNWGMNIDNNCLLPKIPPLESTLICQWTQGHYSFSVLWRLVAAAKSILIGNNIVNEMSNEIAFTKCMEERTAGFGVLSANLTWMGFPPYVLNVGINNVLNCNYREYLHLSHHKRFGTDHTNIPIYEPGRVCWIKIGFVI